MQRASGSLSDTFSSDFFALSFAWVLARFAFSARIRSSTARARSARSFTSRAPRSCETRLRREDASGVAFDLCLERRKPLLHGSFDPIKLAAALERLMPAFARTLVPSTAISASDTTPS